MKNTIADSLPLTDPISVHHSEALSQVGSIWSLIKKLVLPYWYSEDKIPARALLVAVFALNLFFVYFSVKFNRWNGQFFDALQTLDQTKYYSLLIDFVFYISCIVLSLLMKVYLQNYLGFRWRSWMTTTYLNKWFNKKSFYKTLHPEPMIDNPDQRISQDINNFTSTTLHLGITTFSAVFDGAAFAIILWSLSPILTLPFGEHYTVPGYMLWLAIIYSLIATYTIFKVGKPLVKLDFTQEKAEANFRFGLMRIVERKEEVALLNGEKDDYRALKRKWDDIRTNFMQILIRQIYINSAQNIFMNALGVFPLLAAAPMFFAGSITLGVMVQLSGAFGYVSNTLMIFVLNYQSLASWKAIVNRLDQFRAHTDAVDSKNSSIITINDDILHLKEVEIFKTKNAAPFLKVNFSLNKGEKVLLQGASGIGKTTLVKTIAGIWPYANGQILRPQFIEFVPQKPYFPITTLREVILYGNEDKSHSEELMLQMLSEYGLSHLAEHLDSQGDWNTKLSLGEQQRLNFVRISLIKPNWLILDEPTASLDPKNQMNAMQVLFAFLQQSAILTISHSSDLSSMHDKVITL